MILSDTKIRQMPPKHLRITWLIFVKQTEIHIRIGRELKAKAYRIAQERGISISELIRYLIMKEEER